MKLLRVLADGGSCPFRPAAVTASAILLLLVMAASSGCDAPETGTVEATPEPEASAESGETVTLYFPGQGGRLFAEERPVAEGLTAQERARTMVEMLLSGPENRALFPPLSAETDLIDVVLDSRTHVAWVDLGGKNDDIGGSHRELLTLYSLVDTLALGVEEIDRVALLWNGIQGESFAGHIDTTRPLAPDASYISGGE